MTQPEHPPVDQISDLLAGVLPAAEAMDVNAHLASCEACREERTALLDLTALLADEGATPLEMPPDVAASIDAAITVASAERAARVPSIAPERRTSSQRSGRRQPLRWLAGAAAAVAVLGLGVAGLRALPSSNSNDAGSSSPASLHPGAAEQQDGSGRFVGGADPADTPGPSNLPETTSGSSESSLRSAAEVAAAGRQLSSTPADATSPRKSGCAVPLSGGLTTIVTFKGRPAVLTVTRDTRLVTIYDCATATKTLLVTGY